MSEMLRDWRLVHDNPPGAKHSGNLAKRGERTIHATTHVIARAEIDHEIELGRLEWQVAYVRLDDPGVHASIAGTLPGCLDQRRIDVHSH